MDKIFFFFYFLYAFYNTLYEYGENLNGDIIVLFGQIYKFNYELVVGFISKFHKRFGKVCGEIYSEFVT